MCEVVGCGEHCALCLGAPLVCTLQEVETSFNPSVCRAEPCECWCPCVMLALSFWDRWHSYYMYHNHCTWCCWCLVVVSTGSGCPSSCTHTRWWDDLLRPNSVPGGAVLCVHGCASHWHYCSVRWLSTGIPGYASFLLHLSQSGVSHHIPVGASLSWLGALASYVFSS